VSVGTWLQCGSASSGGHVGAGDSQTVAANEDQDASNSSQVSLRLQPARSQPRLAGVYVCAAFSLISLVASP